MRPPDPIESNERAHRLTGTVHGTIVAAGVLAVSTRRPTPLLPVSTRWLP